MNGTSLPSEVLFSHACRFRLGEVKQRWDRNASGAEGVVQVNSLYVKSRPEYFFGRSMRYYIFMIILAAALCGCVQSRHIGTSTSANLIKITGSAVPFEQQFEFREGDSYEFELPNGQTVAVWCERAAFQMAEQTTASGLKTAWGERPFKRPEPKLERIGPNSYALSGWQSYISQGAVTTHGSETSEYELFIDEWRFAITESLRPTGKLPVVIRITESNRKAQLRAVCLSQS
jgi:hypothetical protein